MNSEHFVGFVISEVDYNEYDKIVTLLTDKGFINVLLKGYYKTKSKLVSVFVFYNHLDLVLIKMGNDFYRVKEASIIKSYIGWYEYEYLKTGLMINEIVKYYAKSDLNLYFLYYELVSSIYFYDHNLLLCLFISDILKLNGLSPFVDGDVLTKKSKVNYFSIKDGGFVYSLNNQHDLECLKILRRIFKGGLEYKDSFKNVIIDEVIYKIVIDYFIFHTTIKLYSSEINL